MVSGDSLHYYFPAFVSPRTLWSSALYGGYPVTADPQAESWYPVGFLLLHKRELWNCFVLSAYVLAGSFTYGYVYSLTHSALAAAVGGIVYCMSGFMIAHMSHTAIIHTAAWLPLIIWAVEELRHRLSPAWLGIGAGAVSCCMLGGHPQPFVYSLGIAGIYALVLGLYASNRFCYYASCLVLGVLGIGIAALQLIPTWELARLSNRAELSYDAFVNISLSPRLLFTLPLPYLFGGAPPHFTGLPYTGTLGDFWRPEAVGYVGLLPIMLGAIGFGLDRRRFHWWFWLVVCAASLLLATGNATPVAKVMFHVPAYDMFDVPARHLMTFEFAVSVLAGFGTAAIEHRSASRRCINIGIAICISLVVLDLISVLFFPGWLMLSSCTTEESWPARVFADPAIFVPISILLVSSAVLFAWSTLPASRLRQAGILLVLIVDLGSFAWITHPEAEFPAVSVADPPGFAKRLRARLGSEAQRILPVAGALAGPTSIPPNLSRIWRVPSASGYGPLILARTSTLLGMQTAGQITRFWSDPSDRSLDLVASRFVLVPNEGLEKPYRKMGFQWAGSPMELRLGPGCFAAKSYNAAEAFELPAPFEADIIGLVGFLGCSRDIPQNAEVLQILITNASGRTTVQSITAGRDMAEFAYDCEDVTPYMRHHKAAVFSSFSIRRAQFKPCQGHTYLATVRLAAVSRISRLELRWVGSGGQLEVNGVSLENSRTGGGFPITDLERALAHPERWHLVDEIGSTSVLENDRALPRAWLVSEVISLKPDQILSAIHTSQLPDGHLFDPARVALVEDSIEYAKPAANPRATIKVLKSAGTRLIIKTESRTSGFLVTSDTYYPGWRAEIDGHRTQVFKADYLLRGVIIPPGRHLISFRYQPNSFLIGLSVSAFSVFLLLCCVCLVPKLRWCANHPHGRER